RSGKTIKSKILIPGILESIKWVCPEALKGDQEEWEYLLCRAHDCACWKKARGKFMGLVNRHEKRPSRKG
ncbi:hypothetical protein KAH85_04880, partial [Candidatus Bathyarchaeota archaeon]|nr:hypothetical protein [Candidatus Bathyarchaeota archaeon]